MKPIIAKIRKIRVVSSFNISSIILSSINFISPGEKKYGTKPSQYDPYKARVLTEKTADHYQEQNAFADIIQILGRIFSLFNIHLVNIQLCLETINHNRKEQGKWKYRLFSASQYSIIPLLHCSLGGSHGR